uniref:Putative structural protein n=1 Tax=viral metagenome TaxID=1070528 RepID=A0A6H1ZS78_9ZZZZ
MTLTIPFEFKPTLNDKLVPNGGTLPWKTFTLASTVTTASVTRGSATTATIYRLQPMIFLKALSEAAKENLQFLPVARQETMLQGEHLSIPKRKTFMADADWELSSAEFAAGAEIAWTDITTLEGAEFTPVNKNYGVALTKDAIRKNAVNLIAACREELAYKYSREVDYAVRDAICGTVTTGTPTAPTEMASAAVGCQTIFGGDATDAANSIDRGDVLTTDLIKKALRYITSKYGYYWASNVETKSTVDKNPWRATPGEPLVMFVAPEQMAQLLSDTQFTNAAEFGDREAILNGEFARYLNIRFVQTTTVPGFKSGDNYRVTSTTTAADTDGHICCLVKAQKAAALVWGRKGEFKTYDWPNADQIRMTLHFAYDAGEVFPDGIVRVIVADNEA